MTVFKDIITNTCYLGKYFESVTRGSIDHYPFPIIGYGSEFSDTAVDTLGSANGDLNSFLSQSGLKYRNPFLDIFVGSTTISAFLIFGTSIDNIDDRFTFPSPSHTSIPIGIFSDLGYVPTTNNSTTITNRINSLRLSGDNNVSFNIPFTSSISNIAYAVPNIIGASDGRYLALAFLRSIGGSLTVSSTAYYPPIGNELTQFMYGGLLEEAHSSLTTLASRAIVIASQSFGGAGLNTLFQVRAGGIQGSNTALLLQTGKAQYQISNPDNFGVTPTPWLTDLWVYNNSGLRLGKVPGLMIGSGIYSQRVVNLTQSNLASNIPKSWKPIGRWAGRALLMPINSVKNEYY